MDIVIKTWREYAEDLCKENDKHIHTIQRLIETIEMLETERTKMWEDLENEKARADALQTRLDEYVAEVVAAYVDTPLKL